MLLEHLRGFAMPRDRCRRASGPIGMRRRPGFLKPRALGCEVVARLAARLKRLVAERKVTVDADQLVGECSGLAGAGLGFELADTEAPRNIPAVPMPNTARYDSFRCERANTPSLRAPPTPSCRIRGQYQKSGLGAVVRPIGLQGAGDGTHIVGRPIVAITIT